MNLLSLNRVDSQTRSFLNSCSRDWELEINWLRESFSPVSFNNLGYEKIN